MAYQPKFARKNHRVSPFFVLLGVIVVPISLALTAVLLGKMAPEPNPDCYGQTDDPASLQWLLDEAAFLLDGQELYFSTDVELFEGSLVNYYLDDTIFAITWKEVHDGSVYTFSEVKVNHPSQFRRHLAGGEYGSATQFYTSEMAERRPPLHLRRRHYDHGGRQGICGGEQHLVQPWLRPGTH